MAAGGTLGSIEVSSQKWADHRIGHYTILHTTPPLAKKAPKNVRRVASGVDRARSNK
jgi:hypothetical protein